MPEAPVPPSSEQHPTVTAATATVEQSGGRWEGDFWVEPDGYRVARKFVETFPDLYGPNAKDPDEGKGEIECTDAISKIFNLYTGQGGTFSTWSERHCFLNAFFIGRDYVESSADIPPVPYFWLTEAHYWRAGIMLGRASKKNGDLKNLVSDLMSQKETAEATTAALETVSGLLKNPETRKRVIAIAGTAAAAGGAILPSVVPYALKLLGIST